MISKKINKFWCLLSLITLWWRVSNSVFFLSLYLRTVVSPAKALIPAIRPLLNAILQNILNTVSKVFPHAEQGLKRKREQGAAFFLFFSIFLVSDPPLSSSLS